jgi:hypothetical protein
LSRWQFPRVNLYPAPIESGRFRGVNLALTPVPGCQKKVDAVELALTRCISEGTVKDVDGSPGTYGVGCTLDHVLAFADAYADVVWCAVHGDPASVKELHQLREFANDTASPASAKHLKGQ